MWGSHLPSAEQFLTILMWEKKFKKLGNLLGWETTTWISQDTFLLSSSSYFRVCLKILTQGKKVVNTFYKDMEELDFQILLPDSYYINFLSIRICFPMKIKKSANETNDIDDDLITANNLFYHLVKEISVTKYGSDKDLIPTFFHYEVCQYSDSMLNYLPKDTLGKIEKALFYSKKAVYFNKTSLSRKLHHSAGEKKTAEKRINATDLNIQGRITKFHDILRGDHVYSVPLKYFTDIGKINFLLENRFKA